MENNIYDLAILGAGPAGICAAIYATRAKLNTIWLDRKFVQGGQIVDTYEVDNYPGLPGITGLDLGEAMAGHAEKLGLKPKREPVLSVTDEGEIKGDEPEVPFEEHDGYFKGGNHSLWSDTPSSWNSRRGRTGWYGSFLLCNL